VFTIVFVVAVVGGLAWLMLRPRELVYEGKSVSYLLMQYEWSPHGQEIKPAQDALHKIGTNAIPLYLKWVESKDALLKDKIILLARKQSLIPIRWFTTGEYRFLGRLGFEVLGSDAAPAVPALIKLLNESSDPNIQGEAALSLGRIGPAAQDAVPALIAVLRCFDSDDSYCAVAALGNIHSKPELAVPALIRHLEKSGLRPVDLRRTIESIGNFGTNAQAAIPALEQLAKDPDNDIRSWASDVLKQIKPEAVESSK